MKETMTADRSLPRLAGSKRERRRHPRAITDFSADLTVGTTPYPARVINLSMGGALLHLRRVLPHPPCTVGQRVSVNIRCRGGLQPFIADGKAVLWNESDSTTALLAVQFDEVTGEPAEILEELLKEALTSDMGARGGPPVSEQLRFPKAKGIIG